MLTNDDTSYLVTNVINFSSENLPDLPRVNLLDINEPGSMSVEVDVFVLIEPDLEWLTTNQENIRSRKALTIILTTADKPYTVAEYPDIIDNVIMVDSGSYSVFIKDLIESLTQKNMIGVDFADFRTVIRQGNTATLYSGGYTQDDHFSMGYFDYYFPEAIDFLNSKALFVNISFSLDFIADLDDFSTVCEFFREQMSPDSTVVVTGHFTTDDKGARVSAILVD